MSKVYYYFGYTSKELNWEDIFKTSSNLIIYNDQTLDSVLQDVKYYIITSNKCLNSDISYTSEYISFQDVENVIMSNNIVYIKGFLFLRRKRILITKMINSSCDNDFNKLSNKLNLDNWKYEFYHKKFLFKKMDKLIKRNTIPTLYKIKKDHPLIIFFMDFLRSCFKIINKRIFSIIIIGDTKIGKSICFKDCLINNKYIEYHNSMLEFSKCSDENKKLFRLLDDINWNTVDVMTLKTILNRNVASVDVKYSYGIIYPMINIFLMNKEDYMIFQKKYVDIWSFISNNVAIYPKQENNKVIEEQIQLYDSNELLDSLLFDDIIKLNDFDKDFNDQIENGKEPDIYECIKSKLLDIQPYIYDNKQFIDLTSFDISLIPNRQLIENEMLRKIKEAETKEKYMEKVEKKPKKLNNNKKKKKKKEIAIKNKNCLDYYFNRDKKKSFSESTTQDLPPYDKDNNMDEYDDIDNDIDDDIDGIDNEIDNDNEIYNDIDDDIENKDSIFDDMENSNLGYNNFGRDDTSDDVYKNNDDIMNDSFNC